MNLTAEEIRPSLDITVGVFPTKIQYGDALFTFIEIKNNTNETLVMPHRFIHPHRLYAPFFGIVNQLSKEKEVFYKWDVEALDLIEGVPPGNPPPYELPSGYPKQNLEANESRLIGAKILWCPQYEFSSYPLVRVNFERFVGVANRSRPLTDFSIDRFKKMVVNQNNFVLSTEISVLFIDLLNPDKIIRMSQSTPYSDSMIDIVQPKNVPLKIYARSPETKELLARWFLELSATWSPSAWPIDGIFASPSYVSGSPYNVNASSPQEMADKRQLAHEDYIVFCNKMVTRTPEVDARIKRTNELTNKLLALPDSEVSSHMKEFIVLRGLLVDLRYAEETEAARDKEFEKIVTWIKTSKNKILWVLVLKECGFQGIGNLKHFPMDVAGRYVKKLEEVFPKEFNASLTDLNQEQSK